MSDQDAKFYMLTAEMFDAQTAKNSGLVDKIIDKENLIPEAESLALQIIKHDQTALQLTKSWLQTLSPINNEILETASQLLAQTRASDSARQLIQKYLKR